jgi:hypothetical protein
MKKLIMMMAIMICLSCGVKVDEPNYEPIYIEGSYDVSLVFLAENKENQSLLDAITFEAGSVSQLFDRSIFKDGILFCNDSLLCKDIVYDYNNWDGNTTYITTIQDSVSGYVYKYMWSGNIKIGDISNKQTTLNNNDYYDSYLITYAIQSDTLFVLHTSYSKYGNSNYNYQYKITIDNDIISLTEILTEKERTNRLKWSKEATGKEFIYFEKYTLTKN